MVLINLFVPADSVEDEDRRKKIWGQIFRQSSVADRIRYERVDRFWRETVRAEGWTEQRKLDSKIVFGEGYRLRLGEFNEKSLISLFHHCGPNLKELDLSSFKPQLHPLVDGSIRPEAITLIAQNMPASITSIDVTAFPGTAFLNALPDNLLGLEINVCRESLELMIDRFTLLRAVRFQHGGTKGLIKLPIQLMNNFITNHIELRKFELDGRLFQWEENAGLPALSQLRHLEELLLGETNFEASWGTFRAIVGNDESTCLKNLRRLHIYLNSDPPFFSEDLQALGRLKNLVELRLYSPLADDDILRAVARNGNLKKLDVKQCSMITDEGVKFIVATCKSLVTLDVSLCPWVGEESLRAVVAEVQRRHAGDPPGRQPTSPTDPEIFCLGIMVAPRVRIRDIVAPVSDWLVASAEIDGTLYARPVSWR